MAWHISCFIVCDDPFRSQLTKENQMKKTALPLALAGALVGSASAAPVFNLAGGYTGPINIKFRNWESILPGLAPGAENFGILRITSVTDPDGNPLWSDGQDGAELTGVFRDIIVDSVTVVGTDANVKSTGGLLDIYINPFGSFAATGGPSQGLGGYAQAGCAPGDACYDGISNVAGGGVFLNLAWAPGVDPTDS